MIKHKEVIIEDKIQFSDSLLYVLDVPKGFNHGLRPGNKLTEGQVISEVEEDREIDIQKIPIKGKLQIVIDDEIREGYLIAVEKRFFGKKEIKSPFNGVIKEVEEEFVLIEVKELDKRKEYKNIRIPFNAEVKEIFSDKILLKFSGVQINLFRSKGTSFIGPLKYLTHDQIKDKSKLPNNINNKIVVTDQLTAELYPMLSSLGVGGLIANSVDRALYRTIVILTVPTGIISGFGFTHDAGKNTEIKPVIKNDSVLDKYLVNSDGKLVWFDAEYGRLVIPEDKEPYALKRHKFDIKKLGII